jgi:hypothetical protein
MYGDSVGLRRLFGSLLLVSAVASFAATGCSDITPEPNDEGGGVMDSPTQESDQLRQTEEQQEQQRGGEGGHR